MTGYEDYNRTEFFKAAAEMFIRHGDIMLTPAILPDGLSQREYMDICFAMIRAADVIYLLKGYEESKGAMAELAYAEKLGLEIREQ